MASEHACRLLVSVNVLDCFNTSYVDALCVESLQGPAWWARRTRAASTKQTIILFLSNKCEGM